MWVKLFCILGMVAFMLICFCSWLCQDIMLRRRTSNRERPAEHQGEENNVNSQQGRARKQAVEFLSNFTMILDVAHFLVGANGDDEKPNNKQQENLEKLDYIPSHQSDRGTTTSILVPAPGTGWQKYSAATQEQQNQSRVVSGECAICLNTYLPEDMIVWSTNSKCPHVFHLHCMKNWTKKTEEEVSCPCCRRLFVEEIEKDATEEEVTKCPNRRDSYSSV